MDEVSFFLLRELSSLVSLDDTHHNRGSERGEKECRATGTHTVHGGGWVPFEVKNKTTHPHDDAHALAFVGEREKLQDGEVQDRSLLYSSRKFSNIIAYCTMKVGNTPSGQVCDLVKEISKQSVERAA